MKELCRAIWLEAGFQQAIADAPPSIKRTMLKPDARRHIDGNHAKLLSASFDARWDGDTKKAKDYIRKGIALAVIEREIDRLLGDAAVIVIDSEEGCGDPDCPNCGIDAQQNAPTSRKVH